MRQVCQVIVLQQGSRNMLSLIVLTLAALVAVASAAVLPSSYFITIPSLGEESLEFMPNDDFDGLALGVVVFSLLNRTASDLQAHWRASRGNITSNIRKNEFMYAVGTGGFESVVAAFGGDKKVLEAEVLGLSDSLRQYVRDSFIEYVQDDAALRLQYARMGTVEGGPFIHLG